MKPVLVTGANGFIGRHLVVRLCQEGYQVRAVTRPSVEVVRFPAGVEVVTGDVRDQRAMKGVAAGCEVAFHLAGKAHALDEAPEDVAAYQAVNVDGTRNVLEGAVAGGVRRLVFFSSVKAMGEETSGCVDESYEPRPRTAYGLSKLEAERLVMESSRRTGLETVCLRLPLVYGPGQKGNLARMIEAVDRGLFPPLAKSGSRRSLVHVINVVHAALLAATHPAALGRCYIVADARAYSTLELYEMICRALGKPIPRWHVPLGVLRLLGIAGDAVGRIRGKRFIFDSDALAKLAGSAWYSSQRISQELGYRPLVTFEDALPELVAWYRGAQA